jgi:hypothetical protein
MRLRLICCLLLAAGLGAGQAYAADAADVVRGHFLEINAEHYTQADQYFSDAFRRAFKGDFASMDRYYRTRRKQLGTGYSITGVTRLNDKDRETMRVTVDFNDADPDSAVLVTERLHYYLIREKAVEGSPLRDTDGMAWRIDIFDALAYDTLAEARRRPYLYTREAWSEDEGRELKAQQGLYRVQQALESCWRVSGAYPEQLLGADNRRDDLIRGKYLPEKYPACGFADRPMECVEFGIRSSGDFSYYSYDTDGDGKRDAYWLLLHGKVEQNALFAGRDCVLLLAQSYAADQPGLAPVFAAWWQAQRNERIDPGPALGSSWAAVPTAETATGSPLVDPAQAPENAAQDTPPVTLDAPGEPVAVVAPAAPEMLLPPPPPLDATQTDMPEPMPVDPAATVSREEAAVAMQPLPVPETELVIHSWGFR